METGPSPDAIGQAAPKAVGLAVDAGTEHSPASPRRNGAVRVNWSRECEAVTKDIEAVASRLDRCTSPADCKLVDFCTFVHRDSDTSELRSLWETRSKLLREQRCSYFVRDCGPKDVVCAAGRCVPR